MQVKTFCFFCIRKIWQVFAITLVTLAVLVSVVKYSLPYANDYRSDIENIIYQQLDVNISIGSISASWESEGPALVLENLTFVDNQSAPIALSIAKTSLQLNVLESLRNLQVRSNYFVLEGFSAQVDVAKLAEVNDSGSADFEQQSLIESLFLGETGHFSIQSSQLNLRMKSGLQHTLLLNDLIWQNSPNSHEGEGEVAIPGLQQGRFAARLSLTGSTLRDLAGQVYLQAQNLDVAEWLTEQISTQKKHIATELNGELWLGLEHGKVQEVTINTLPSQMQWQEAGERHSLALTRGQLKLMPQAKQWHLTSSELEFALDGEQFIPAKLQGLFSDNQRRIWFDDVSLELVKQFTLLAQADWVDSVTGLDVQGTLQGRISWDAEHQFDVWLNGSQLSWSNYNGIPGVNNLRAEMLWKNNAAVINLFSEQSQLETADMFTKPLAYEQLNGELQLYQLNNQWHLSSDSLWINNQDITLAAEMHLTLGDVAKLDLYAEMLGGNAQTAGDYFPQTVMQRSLIDYLNRGILGGQLRTTQVLLSGPLSAFPFEDRSGQFEVLSHITQAEFMFAPDWPALKNGDVTLHFANERMDIFANAGDLINQQLSAPVVVTLPNLNQADNLYVDIVHTTDAQTLLPFFAKTPLSEPLVDILSIVQGKGEMSTQIKLDIDLRSLAVSAIGSVDLNGADVMLKQPGMQLSGVTGILHFVDDKIELTKSNATWLDMPISINVMADGDHSNYAVNVNATLLAQSQRLVPFTQGLLDGFIEGQNELHTNVQLNFSEQGFSYNAKFNANLEGVESSFPAPYQKDKEETWLLQGEVQGDDISNLITVNLADRLFFNGILDNESAQLSQAQLSVGRDNKGLTGEGFHVAITQEQLELDPWIEFIDRIISLPPKNPDERGVLPSLEQLTVQSTYAQVANIPFSDLEVRMFPSNDGMTMRINAKEARITAMLPESGSSRPIRIDSDYLRINLLEQKVDSKATNEELDWLTRVPAIEFNCSDCKLETYQLDKVSASLFGDGKQLSVSEIVVDKQEHVLRGAGRWINGVSYFDGIMNSKDIGELFDEFDLTSTIKDSRANLNYQLSWHGAPYDFDIDSLAGEITWELGEGHLAEVSDQGARVFSLLSLDSLIRKLKLDFRDVFSKGFFYNQMKGSVQLDKGIAYTKDTKLDGVPADLSIQGYANLNTQEINYDLAVAPQVTSSIPVIVAWMVNPVSGLAALALDKVIHSARVISEIKFKVTGTMQEPVVKEIDRKSREVEIPQAARNQPPVNDDKPATTEQPKPTELHDESTDFTPVVG
ncbi:YhdP family protein [Pseudoalteromonas byunsanensis]|uniref:TIGR02099 family protein n=1 Tax=Pseudoalteromonas byunsanensis TaxID=327939 RepID=A0A1S1N7N8_9GAMM|nr:YhdP family protein [Pseudoalteromonas byunsanensis]OHU95380.1 TIGR02099 family protein [Pseudoalteromonas byunsanensis]